MTHQKTNDHAVRAVSDIIDRILIVAVADIGIYN
jgi:hypothetical protein